eukprot:CAMPEP_0175987970 /NCGR_PEP_ID=MMETSP0108-20121206/50995_1 /TAXON_ID=195067 ORGANISM="Goniomonas pacifica, Strain CCMP1869" /NCGR_SAMPLE_ID=MMETSP0108 /ASSEMBLY_ACC=CAM_ASM_000204 /LENGTH=253 /DNA_ID=CAMNT_0017319287 /DNA_START=612 /DNA_END=1374 /DNA_ORIENTATION=+
MEGWSADDTRLLSIDVLGGRNKRGEVFLVGDGVRDVGGLNAGLVCAHCDRGKPTESPSRERGRILEALRPLPRKGVVDRLHKVGRVLGGCPRACEGWPVIGNENPGSIAPADKSDSVVPDEFGALGDGVNPAFVLREIVIHSKRRVHTAVFVDGVLNGSDPVVACGIGSKMQALPSFHLVSHLLPTAGYWVLVRNGARAILASVWGATVLHDIMLHAEIMTHCAVPPLQPAASPDPGMVAQSAAKRAEGFAQL